MAVGKDKCPATLLTEIAHLPPTRITIIIDASPIASDYKGNVHMIMTTCFQWKETLRILHGIDRYRMRESM